MNKLFHLALANPGLLPASAILSKQGRSNNVNNLDRGVADMGYSIKQQIRGGLPQVGSTPYRQVHAHSTGNSGSTAQNEADYMNRKDINSGFFTHVVGNGQVIQVGNVNRGAWDVGGGYNYETYAAVELIESHKSKDEFTRDYKIYVELLRDLAKQAGIPITVDSSDLSGIKTHNYCTYHQPNNGSDHVDPIPYLKKWGISQEQFAKDVASGSVVAKRTTPEGDWIKADLNAKITVKGQNIYNNFKWEKRTSTDDVINQTFHVTGKYEHENGSTYYSLYDSKGGWHGYINADFTDKGIAPEGDWIAEYRTVKITCKDQFTWNNFKWEKRQSTNDIYGQTFLVKGKYNHRNGTTYYSLYDSKGGWHGYINSVLTTTVSNGSTSSNSGSSNSSSSGSWKAESGYFTPNQTLPLTVNDSGNGALIANISAGSAIKYDAYRIGSDYVWIRQPRDNGYGYMATGNVKNGKRSDYWGSFS